MDQMRKIRVERVLDLATSARQTMPDEDAARVALREADQGAIEELAAVAIVAILRRRDRQEALQVEKRATIPLKDPYVPSAEAVEADLAIQERTGREIRDMIARYERSMKMQWTAELLGTTFTLEDGSRVEWGEATIEQHRERAAMFTGNALANMEGAARHEAAIRDLESAGVPTLRDLVEVREPVAL